MSFRRQSLIAAGKVLVATGALCFGLFALPSVTSVSAQERIQRSPSILEFFGFKKVQPETSAPAIKKRAKKTVGLKVEHRKKQKNPVLSTVRGGYATAPAGTLTGPILPVEKLENAKSVLVVGDFMAGGVAEGLVDAFAGSTDVKIVEKWNGSSGFVRDDYYDWPASLPSILSETKPAVVVIMIGTNDRQQMLVGTNRETVSTPAWTQEYEKRVTAVAQVLKAGGVPIIWVGEPALRSTQMSASMTAFNDIYRKNIEAVGGTFVDIWDGFVDENGIFQQTGVDMNGLPARLRGNDGISFATAGKRKAAFYVEKPLRLLLGDTQTPVMAALPKPSTTGFVGPLLPAPVVITRTEPMAINDPALDGGDELLGAAPKPSTSRPIRSVADALMIEGIAPEPKPGRVDDFTWKNPAQGEMAAPMDVSRDKTGATK